MQNTPKELKVRPSKMGLTLDCRGSVKAELPYPYETSNAAERGKALHDAMALLFQAGATPEVWAQIRETLKAKPAKLNITDVDIDKLTEVYALGRNQEPAGKVIIWVEKPLDLSFMGMDGGKPDLVYISLEHKAAVIVDWKFGARPTEDPQHNPQLQDYGAAVCDKVKKEFGITLESVEGVIIQPYSMKKDDWARSHTWATSELRDIARAHKAIAAEAKAPDAPRVAGPHCVSGWCNARKDGVAKDGTLIPACAEYVAYSEGRAAVKAETEAQELKTVTMGTPVEVRPLEPIITPVLVIAAEIVALAEEKKTTAMALRVIDDTSAASAGALSKDIRGMANLINKNREIVKKPFLEMGRSIDAAAKQATVPLEEAASHLDGQVTAWQRAKADNLRRLQEEEQARQRAADNARMEEERAAAAKQREVEESARKAQEAAAKADDLKGAAKKKAELEAKRLQEEAEAQRLKQAELETQQAQARLRAEQEARDAEALRQKAEEEANKKVAGYRQAVEITSTITDITKVPAAWMTAVLMINQKSLDLLVKQGTLNEKNAAGWLDIKRETVSVRSR